MYYVLFLLLPLKESPHIREKRRINVLELNSEPAAAHCGGS